MYPAPSAKFKPSIETWDSNLLGVLVVGFPVEHRGGILTIQREGSAVNYDWSTGRDDSSHAAIRWAAFLPGCEYEVSEVTFGYQVLLTYNLYASNRVGQFTGYNPTLNICSQPLFLSIQSVVQKRFLGNKGKI